MMWKCNSKRGDAPGCIDDGASSNRRFEWGILGTSRCAPTIPLLAVAENPLIERGGPFDLIQSFHLVAKMHQKDVAPVQPVS